MDDFKRGAAEVVAPRRRAVRVNEEELVSFEPFSADTSMLLVARPRHHEIDLAEWTTHHRSLVEQRLRQHGAILFRGFSIDTVNRFKEYSLGLTDKLDGYDERTSPRKELGDNIFTSTIYPKEQPLHFHNANSYSTFWPMKIWFGCIVRSPIGGRTPIADCRKVLEVLDPKLRQRFEEKGVKYLRNFMPGVGLSWQETFATDDPKEVDAYCKREEIAHQWVRPDHLRTIQVRHSVAVHPVTRDRVWFNQAPLFHVAMLKEGVSQRFLEEFAEEDLPSNSYYGDGSPIGRSELEAILEAYERAELRFDWEVGDVVLLDNMLVAHAREPFDGDRLITVAFCDRHFGGPNP
jgi:alpha-ketoglutarate-dependent taurine dioxygenase